MKQSLLKFISVCVSVCSLCCATSARPSVFSWVHWKNDLPSLETQVKGLQVHVENPITGQSLDTGDSLRKLGWRAAPDGFLVTPPQAGGNRVAVHVKGLPKGEHHVYLQFWGRPRKAGEKWWFYTWMNMGNGIGQGKRENTPPHAKMYQYGNHDRIRLIRGTGGYDPSTVYEIYLGKSPSNDSVSFWFQRYQWSQMSKIGSARIETIPDINVSSALDQTPENTQITRQMLMAEKVQVGIVHSALKVRPKSLASLHNINLRKDIDLDAAQNEWEGAQLLVLPTAEDLKDLTWNISPLKRTDGTVLDASCSLSPVGYMKLRHFDLDQNGWWPDPIMKHMNTITIPQGDLQALWFSCKIAEQALPGLYHGHVVLDAPQQLALTIPITIRVRSFKLDQMPKLPVVMGCNLGDGNFETDYKINPSTIYGWENYPDSTFQKWAERGASAINLGYLWQKNLNQTTRKPTEQQLNTWIATLKSRLKLAAKHGLQDTCYLYMFDEAAPQWHPAIQQLSEAIKKAIPTLPIMTTANLPWTGSKSIHSIDRWCPSIARYDFSRAEEARRQGKQVWMYVCNTPEKPYPNLRISANTAMDHRIMLGFMAKAMRYDGFLYWATQHGWQAPMNSQKAYTNWTIIDDGDGQLYQRDTKGPIPSLRLEVMRDGLEDYDLLCIVQELLQKQKTSSEYNREKWQKLASYLKPGNDMVTSQTDFTQDTDFLERTRRQLMDFIEESTAHPKQP